MITFDLITALIAFAFVSSVTPGPNNLMLMTSGINYGFARSIPHMMGIGVGFIVMLVLVGLGLGQIFIALPVTYQILKIISIFYLTYLAFKIATAKPPQTKNDRHSSKPFSFIQAALFQWVNPKAWVMTITAISTYMPEASLFLSVMIVAIIFGLVMLPAISLWAFLGAQMQRFLNKPKMLRSFNIMAAILLMASLYPVIF
jgi:threonine/homoserine/homoserine lactone efflux protein